MNEGRSLAEIGLIICHLEDAIKLCGDDKSLVNTLRRVQFILSSFRRRNLSAENVAIYERRREVVGTPLQEAFDKVLEYYAEAIDEEYKQWK